MQISVTLSANAGVCIQANGYKIWVDALHDRPVTGFSSVDQDLWKKLYQSEAFSNPDYICYTHDHPDHYSKSLTDQALSLWSETKLLMPKADMPPEMVDNGAVQLSFQKLPHEGVQYKSVPHYGILLRIAEKNILIPGDCAIGAQELAAWIGERQIDLVLLDFPWLTLKNGRAFVESAIRPRAVGVYHLPFEKDDVFGYRKAVKKTLEQRFLYDVILLSEPLQTVYFDL